MYVNLHVLSFKFATKVKMEGRAAGKENAEAGKRRSKKGKMHPEEFYQWSKKRFIQATFYTE